MATNSPTKATGSCHCGKIRYEVLLPSSETITVTRCNCTMCQKPGFVSLSVSRNDFTLTSPATKAELPDYVWRNPKGHRYFCDKCGVQVMIEAVFEFGGQTVDHFAINANTLDQPQDGIDLRDFKIEYFDGLHDNWYAGKQDKPFSGGTK